jgi:DNA invertase Pin-like site-specific DNA recombinase
MEVASFRERAHAALLQKAKRGVLVRRVAIGYVKGPDDRIEKDPDARVRATIDLIFRKFAKLGSVRYVNAEAHRSCRRNTCGRDSCGGHLHGLSYDTVAPRIVMGRGRVVWNSWLLVF